MKKKKSDKKRPPEKPAGKPAEAHPDEWAGLGLRPKQRALLVAYSCCGSLRLAAKAANVSRRSHYRWLKGDEKYIEAFRVAKEHACEILEDEARRRAVEGVAEPVYYEGGVCGHRQVFSDVLLMFLLKASNPEKYRERFEVAHRGGGEPITVNVNLASEMLAQGKELLGKVLAAALKPGVPGVGAGRSSRP